MLFPTWSRCHEMMSVVPKDKLGSMTIQWSTGYNTMVGGSVGLRGCASVHSWISKSIMTSVSKCITVAHNTSGGNIGVFSIKNQLAV